ITMGQRRIPTQSAKHVRGRRVFGGTRQFLPLRVNQAGVMPVIFASSLLMLPIYLFKILSDATGWGWATWVHNVFERQGYIYNVGAAFLAVIAIIPSLISTSMGVDYRVASFYGGTGLLIVVSVALDLVQKINSHLVMRNYPGLTES